MRELSLHLLDLARNSIEAGATQVELVVVEEPPIGLFSFVLRDNGRGMDEATLARAADPFFTSRTTRRVGMGLALMRATCEHCDGTLEVTSEPGKGTIVQGHLLASHLDCPPLGDMGAMVQSMACEAQIVDFLYHHEVGKEVFVLDTRTLKSKLGRSDLGDAAVLCWIRDHVNEALMQMYRGS